MAIRDLSRLAFHNRHLLEANHLSTEELTGYGWGRFWMLAPVGAEPRLQNSTGRWLAADIAWDLFRPFFGRRTTRITPLSYNGSLAGYRLLCWSATWIKDSVQVSWTLYLKWPISRCGGLGKKKTVFWPKKVSKTDDLEIVVDACVLCAKSSGSRTVAESRSVWAHVLLSCESDMDFTKKTWIRGSPTFDQEGCPNLSQSFLARDTNTNWQC
jgi:hypothetical protein